MSYSIVYDRKFLKTTRGIIPMVLTGPSNVTQNRWVGKRYVEVRVRSWCMYNEEIMDVSEADLMQWVAERFDPTSNYECFQQRGQWVCQKDMAKWFANGAKHAQSLESILAANRGQSLRCYIQFYPDKQKFAHQTLMEADIKDTPTLEAWIDKARIDAANLTVPGSACYISMEFYGDHPLAAAATDRFEPIVVKNKHGGYVSEYITERSISFTDDLSKAVVFESDEDARTQLGTCWQGLRYVTLKGQQKAEKQKDYLLKFGGGRLAGAYFTRCSRSKIHATWSRDKAKGFATEAAVIKYAQQLRDKGYDSALCSNFVICRQSDASYNNTINI